MKGQRIQKLSSRDCNIVRASIAVPTFHAIAEELIANAIDANAASISVKVNVSALSLEVIDDGFGIDQHVLDSYIGNWSCSSKNNDESRLGFKGEALAAIAEISNVTIISRPNNQQHAYVKCLPCGEVVRFLGVLQCGTTVRVDNVFSCLAVRKKSMNKSNELTQIKEYVQRMSILHHKISWQLIDAGSNKLLRNLCAHSSVSARFLQFHSAAILTKMKEVTVRSGSVQLAGLMSQVTMPCCHFTKEFQFMYINNRWLRGGDLVSTLVNEMFAERLEVAGLVSTGSGGPRAKHFNPQKQSTHFYPCFVMQLSCPLSCYDMFSEPDKSVAIFGNRRQLEQCVELLLDQVMPPPPPPRSQPLSLSYQTSAKLKEDDVVACMFSVSNKCTEQSTGENSSPAFESLQNNLFVAAFSDSDSALCDDSNSINAIYTRNTGNNESRNKNSDNNINTCLHDDSVLNPDDNCFVCNNSPLATVQLSCDGNVQLRSFSVSVTRTESDADVNGDWSCDSPTPCYDLEIDGQVLISSQERNLFSKFICVDNAKDFGAIPINVVDNAITEQECSEMIFDNFEYGNVPDVDNTLCESISQESTGVFSTSFVSHNRQVQNQARTADVQSTRCNIMNPSIEAATRSVGRSVRSTAVVSRDMLQNIQVIGQADCKYIMAISKDGCLLAFDQHACDERVQLEDLMTQVPLAAVRDDCASDKPSLAHKLKGSRSQIDMSETVVLSRAQADILHSRTALLAAWGFVYSTCPTSACDRQCDADDNVDSSESVTLQLTACPCVLGERLTIHDLTEFLQYLAETQNSSLPDGMVKPPALHRICASKACRKAIKFGDSLTAKESETIIEMLTATKLPFQCAHGRPSVVPLLTNITTMTNDLDANYSFQYDHNSEQSSLSRLSNLIRKV